MIFTSPIWLIALAPWLGGVVWLLWGRRPRVAVPFLPLWQGPVERPRAKRHVQAPPPAVTLCLIGALLGLLAAAKPRISAHAGKATWPVTVIVDRGAAMSARGAKAPRFEETADEAWPELQRRLGPDADVHLISVPSSEQRDTSWAQALATIHRLQRTAVDPSEALTSALANSTIPVPHVTVVISDQRLDSLPPQVIQIAPMAPARDVRITMLAAREHPTAQVMARLHNRTSHAQAKLTVGSAGNTVEKRIQLPARDNERDYFIDLARLGDTVHAELRVDTDSEIADQTWLAREEGRAPIEFRVPATLELRRMVDVYEAVRGSTERSARLPIVADVSQVQPNSSAVVLAPATQTLALSGPPRIFRHAVTQAIDWDHLPRMVSVSSDPPAGWHPVVTSAGHALVAVRDQPARAVWVGFNSREWAATPDYVIFWANVFDWAGGAGETWVSYPLEEWSPQWKPTETLAGEIGRWPGLYRRDDGAPRAFHGTPAGATLPAGSDWRGQLASIGAPPRSGINLSMPLAFLAALCVTGAAVAWKRRPAKLAANAVGKKISDPARFCLQ